MQFIYTEHWLRKRKKRRQDISDFMIEYCIMSSDKIKDRLWDEVWNAIAFIPPSNKALKVVYKIEGKNIKILTAYWLYGR